MYKPIRCPNCGNQIFEETQYCSECGTYIWPEIPEDPNMHKTDYSPFQYSIGPFISVFAILIIVLIIVIMLGLVFINFLGNQNNEDNTSPTIVRTDPADGATDVEPFFSLKIFFSEPMTNCTTLHYDLWQIITDDTETKWIDDKTAEITNLSFQTFGNVTVNFYGDFDLRDKAGNMLLDNYEWTFTTRPPKIDILSTTIFRRPNDTLIYIYGEVKNQEDFNLIGIEFNATSYDADQNLVRTSYLYSYTSPYIINPGEIVPYMSYYSDIDEVVEEVVVEVNNFGIIEIINRYDGLEIIRDEGYFEYGDEGYKYYVINGTMKNNGDCLAEKIMVTASFYDSNGQIVGAYDFALEPSELDVNQTLDFEIGMPEILCDVSSIDSYKLIAHELW